MKIRLINVGKTTDDYLKTGIADFSSRLKHYVNFEILDIAPVKKSGTLTIELLKQKESEKLLKSIGKADCLVLLDEKGKNYTSVEFADFIAKRQNASVREMVFVTGGAWGFANQLYERANHKIALSKMTFSHQMVRLFFTEQLYRAFTILRGESYHNE